MTLIMGFSGAGRVLERVAHRVADHRGLVGLRAPCPSLPSSMYFLRCPAPPEFDSVLASGCPVEDGHEPKAPREVVDAKPMMTGERMASSAGVASRAGPRVQMLITRQYSGFSV